MAGRGYQTQLRLGVLSGLQGPHTLTLTQSLVERGGSAMGICFRGGGVEMRRQGQGRRERSRRVSWWDAPETVTDVWVCV